MKAIAIAITAAVALLPAVAAAAPIEVARAWIAAPPAGAPTAAGYVDLRNEGAAPDVLLGGETPAAGGFQLHSMSMAGGVMRMRPVSGAPVPPHGVLQMRPMGGLHLMLTRLKRPLKPGDRVPAVLRFAHAGAVRTEFVVQPAGAPAMP